MVHNDQDLVRKEANTLRVAVISAEAVPYSKTGGLGDVAGALPKALKQIGIDSLLITPCYWQTKGEYLWKTAIDDLWVTWRGKLSCKGILQ
ncbi:MAG: glycogen/starch synthase [Acidobacteria bacterium]|nr:glycogen/starch synthase [Acidobacteriota bacterium]